MKLQRKTISFFNKKDIMFVMTYMVNDDIVNDLQIWIDETEQDNMVILYRISQTMSSIKAKSKNEILEKTIFNQSKNFKKFMIKFDEFRTRKVALAQKPYRNFIKLNENEIESRITNYIRGE